MDTEIKIKFDPDRVLSKRDPMIYGHFLEHFHRQIYGGVFDPDSPLSDEDGFREDVLEALKKIKVPVIRWPGGCFVSSYDWKKGVGKRVPTFDISWRVEEPNTFGTDEFVKFCRKIGCEPYICTNAGTGSALEMAEWMQYCNLESEGEFARMRIANGHKEPYNVKYWSVGNENYGTWEIGAKDAREWGRLVLESTKMLRRVDPEASMSAAALGNIEWDTELLKTASDRLDWISIHAYWDGRHEDNDLAGYEKCMYFTEHTGDPIKRTKGLLAAMGLEKRVRIAFDEWNLRGWCHPNVHTVKQYRDQSTYVKPRDLNDDNSVYTMADAVFSACFLNECLRNADIVGMANFSPVVNTRGAIFTYDGGIVKRSTYHVFDMFVNLLGDEVIDSYIKDNGKFTVNSQGVRGDVNTIDAVATRNTNTSELSFSIINKHPEKDVTVTLNVGKYEKISFTSLTGNGKDDYNDIGRNNVIPFDNTKSVSGTGDGNIRIRVPAHSVNVLTVK